MLNAKGGGGRRLRKPRPGLTLDSDCVQDNVPVNIIDGIYIGSVHCAFNRESLAQYGITHILNISGVPATYPKNFTYLQVTMRDKGYANLLSAIPAANIFIESCIDSGGNVLVHCKGGALPLCRVRVRLSHVHDEFGLRRRLQNGQTETQRRQLQQRLRTPAERVRHRWLGRVPRAPGAAAATFRGSALQLQVERVRHSTAPGILRVGHPGKAVLNAAKREHGGTGHPLPAGRRHEVRVPAMQDPLVRDLQHCKYLPVGVLGGDPFAADSWKAFGFEPDDDGQEISKQ